jgi:ribosomal protein S21
MSVVVNSDEPIDAALRRLHREVLRENIIEVLKERTTYRTDSQRLAAIRKEYAKRKRKRRQSIRRRSLKGTPRR